MNYDDLFISQDGTHLAIINQLIDVTNQLIVIINSLERRIKQLEGNV